MKSFVGTKGKKPGLGSDLQKRLGTDVDKLKADPCRLTEDQFEPITQKILNKVIAAQIVQAKELQMDSWDKAEDIVIYFLDDGKFMEINFDALLYYKTFEEMQYIRFLLHTDQYVDKNRYKSRRLESMDTRLRLMAVLHGKRGKDKKYPGFQLKHITPDGTEEVFEKTIFKEQTSAIGNYIKFKPASGTSAIIRPTDLTSDIVDLIDLRALLFQIDPVDDFLRTLKESVVGSIVRQEKKMLDDFLKNKDLYRRLPEG